MNEIVFICSTLIALALPMISARFGYGALCACLVFLTMMTLVITAFIVDLFGFALSAGIIFFAAIFLLTDIVSEIYGHKKAYFMAITAIIVNILFVTLGFVITSMIPLDSSPVIEGIRAFFTFIPRLLAGGIIAFALSQLIDIYVFGKFRKVTNGKHLWLRNIGSTSISQFFDTALFVLIAFYGVLPTEILFEVFVTGYVAKVIIALCDTPFCYIARYVAVKKE